MVKDALRFLLGSAAVYLVLAACNGSALFSGGGGGDGGGVTSDAKADESGSRLKARYVVGADGSKVSAGLWDSQLQAECTFSLAGDSAPRCLPSGSDVLNAVTSGYYADEACAIPVGRTDIGRACTATLLRLTSQCDHLTRIYQFGGYVTKGYAKNGDKCTGALFGGATFYAAGPEVPPSTYQQGTITHD